eukprot:scaffold16229_cov57-Phaeocystis_antarctica.AAC.2
MKRMAQQACVQEAGRVASDGVARRPAPKALTRGHSERLRRRKQPEQAPLASDVSRSGAKFLHSAAGVAAHDLVLESLVALDQRDRARLGMHRSDECPQQERATAAAAHDSKAENTGSTRIGEPRQAVVRQRVPRRHHRAADVHLVGSGAPHPARRRPGKHGRRGHRRRSRCSPAARRRLWRARPRRASTCAADLVRGRIMPRESLEPHWHPCLPRRARQLATQLAVAMLRLELGTAPALEGASPARAATSKRALRNNGRRAPRWAALGARAPPRRSLVERQVVEVDLPPRCDGGGHTVVRVRVRREAVGRRPNTPNARLAGGEHAEAAVAAAAEEALNLAERTATVSVAAGGGEELYWRLGCKDVWHESGAGGAAAAGAVAALQPAVGRRGPQGDRAAAALDCEGERGGRDGGSGRIHRAALLHDERRVGGLRFGHAARRPWSSVRCLAPPACPYLVTQSDDVTPPIGDQVWT